MSKRRESFEVDSVAGCNLTQFHPIYSTEVVYCAMCIWAELNSLKSFFVRWRMLSFQLSSLAKVLMNLGFLKPRCKLRRQKKLGMFLCI